MESLKIHNPFDFACPRCVTRLHLGPRGKLVMLSSLLGGLLTGQLVAKLWTESGLASHDSLLLLLSVIAVLTLSWQCLALYFADARARLPKRR